MVARSADAYYYVIPSFLNLAHYVALWPACGRLIGRSFAPHELPSLMEAIASSKDERDMTYTLLRDDAQTFIDVTDEARYSSFHANQGFH